MPGMVTGKDGAFQPKAAEDARKNVPGKNTLAQFYLPYILCCNAA